MRSLSTLTAAIHQVPYKWYVNAPEPLDYHRELRQLADASKDVQGAAELLARWVVLQLPAEARGDVKVPEDWVPSDL